VHYLLIYDLSDDYLERRGPLRAEHIGLARKAAAQGDIVLAGALANPADSAVFLFTGDSPAAAEAFAREDPYVLHGLVTKWRVREWTTVVGKDAAVVLTDLG
jgi:uncharacterized protein